MTFPDKMREQFLRHYGTAPRLFRAPGRVNLIGEHTDYNDGFVFPAAINFYNWVAISPRDDDKLSVYSETFRESVDIDLRDTTPAPRKHWSDYVRGVAMLLRIAGCHIRGTNLLIDSTVPLGAGLSSSAALEVSTALALLGAFNLSLPRLEMAKLCQRAENEYAGARCGIMDQFVCVHAKARHALLLDCRSLEHQSLAFDPAFTLVACNTMVKHDLATGAYNQRRAECEEGVRLLGQIIPRVRALRDVTIEELEHHAALLPPNVFRRCRHVVGENERVLKAAEYLESNDIAGFGRLMSESHRSLRDDYEVSCAELDLMVDIASHIDGVIGARMTGGGFGGCTINVVRSECVKAFAAEISSGYHRQTGKQPDIYVSHPAGGAEEVLQSDVPVEA